MRINIDEGLARDFTLLANSRLGVTLKTLTGTETLQANCTTVQMLDPGGAGRTVKLPPSPKKGDLIIIVNTADAAEVITVQDSGGNALTPACTPTQNETAIIIYSGDATLGWRSTVALGA